MNTAETAYAKAVKLIKQTKEFGLTHLDLWLTEATGLDRIPPEINILPNLKSLSLDGTNITDLRPLSELINLTFLSINSTPVDSLDPVASLRELRSLQASNTRVSDLKPASSLRSLSNLGINRTKTKTSVLSQD